VITKGKSEDVRPRNPNGTCSVKRVVRSIVDLFVCLRRGVKGSGNITPNSKYAKKKAGTDKNTGVTKKRGADVDSTDYQSSIRGVP